MFVLHQCLWIGGSLFCAVTLVCGFWKMRINEFPLFFVFLAWKVVGFLVLFRFRYVQSGTLWGWCVLSLIEISFVLEVLLLYQMAAMLIFSHSSLAKRLRPLPAGVLAGLILCAAVVAALTPTASSFPLIRALHQMSVSQDFIEVGLLLALFLITGLVGLSWKALATGVALGWGISSAVNICAMFLLGRLGQSFYLSADTLRLAGFQVCVLIWFGYVLLQKPAANGRLAAARMADLISEVSNLRRIMSSFGT